MTKWLAVASAFMVSNLLLHLQHPANHWFGRCSVQVTLGRRATVRTHARIGALTQPDRFRPSLMACLSTVW